MVRFMVLCCLLISQPASIAGGTELATAPAPGRVAELEGRLLLLPAAWDDWREAEPNSALVAGDRLRSSRDSTAALEFSSSLMASLAPRSELRLDRREGVLVLELLEGSLVVCGREGGEAASVVSPHGSAWLQAGGFYRIDVTPRRTTILVSAGLAELEMQGRVRTVRPGRLGDLANGASMPRVRSSAGRRWDAFDRDANDACERILGGESELDLVGARDLDGHGEWVLIGGLRYWRPFSVSAGWRPFGDGCFRWHPSWGWYFIPRTSWGWVTHHHGWWDFYDDWGWVWHPESLWHPHRVRFRYIDDHLYWCPRGRGDGRDRDDRHDDKDRLPAHAWSRAPVQDFNTRPIVRVRPALGTGELPRLRPGLGGRTAPPGRLEQPPLPPRADPPLVVRGRAPGVRRPAGTVLNPRPVPRRPGELQRVAPSERPEDREGATSPSPVRRPDGVRPAIIERDRDPGVVASPADPPALPPARVRPRPWSDPVRGTPAEPAARPERPATRNPAAVQRETPPQRAVTPRPVRPAASPKPVVRPPVSRETPAPPVRVSPPEPVRVREPKTGSPTPAQRSPLPRRKPVKPVPVPPPRPAKPPAEDDAKRSTR
jgi:hypothetical protein